MSNELTRFIREENLANVRETLEFLLHECSADEAPTPEELSQWCNILIARGKPFTPLAQQCQQALEHTNDTP